MECREGYIKSIDDDKIIVSVKRNPMCSHCKSKDACIDSAEGSRIINVEIERNSTHDGLKENDRVEIEYKSSRFLLDTAIAYLMPAVLLIISVVISQYVSLFHSPDINSGFFFFAGLLLGIIILVIYEKLIKKKKKLNLRIKKY